MQDLATWMLNVFVLLKTEYVKNFRFLFSDSREDFRHLLMLYKDATNVHLRTNFLDWLTHGEHM